MFNPVRTMFMCMDLLIRRMTTYRKESMTMSSILTLMIDVYAAFYFVSVGVFHYGNLGSSREPCHAAIVPALLSYLTSKSMVYPLVVNTAYNAGGGQRIRQHDIIYGFYIAFPILAYFVIMAGIIMDSTVEVQPDGLYAIFVTPHIWLLLASFGISMGGYLAGVFMMATLGQDMSFINWQLATKEIMGCVAIMSSNSIPFVFVTLMPGQSVLLCGALDLIYTNILVHIVTSAGRYNDHTVIGRSTKHGVDGLSHNRQYSSGIIIRTGSAEKRSCSEMKTGKTAEGMAAMMV